MSHERVWREGSALRRDIVNSLDDLLDRYQTALGRLEAWGVSVPPTSRLQRYETRLANLLKDPSPFLVVTEADRFDFAFELREIDEICEITEAFADPPEEAALQRLRMLPTGTDGPDNEVKAAARDAQYELHLAAVLKVGGLPIRFGEPDLLVTTSAGDLVIEAKRPKSASRVDDRVRKAVRQVRDHPGAMIALSLDRVLRPAGRIIVAQDETDLAPAVASLAVRFVSERAKELTRRVKESRVSALLFTTRMPGFLESTGHVSLGSNFHIEPVYDEDEAARDMIREVQHAFHGNF